MHQRDIQKTNISSSSSFDMVSRFNLKGTSTWEGRLVVVALPCCTDFSRCMCVFGTLRCVRHWVSRSVSFYRMKTGRITISSCAYASAWSCYVWCFGGVSSAVLGSSCCLCCVSSWSWTSRQVKETKRRATTTNSGLLCCRTQRNCVM